MINPENQFANTILNIAPPLRRELGIVSFCVNTQSSIVETQLMSIDSKYDIKSDIVAEMSSAAKKCSTDSYQVNNNYIRQYQLFHYFKTQWTGSILARQKKLSTGLN